MQRLSIILIMLFLSGCQFSGYRFVGYDLNTPEGVNQYVNDTIQYSYYHSKDPRPIEQIRESGIGNCTDIASYKQYLLTKAGITSYFVKGVTIDNQLHAVVMVYEDGDRWFLDNRQPFMTRTVFKDRFYNVDTREVMQ